MFLHGPGPALEGNKAKEKVFKAQGIYPESGKVPAKGSSVKKTPFVRASAVIVENFPPIRAKKNPTVKIFPSIRMEKS